MTTNIPRRFFLLISQRQIRLLILFMAFGILISFTGYTQTDSSAHKSDTSGKSQALVVQPLISCSISGTTPVIKGDTKTYNLICDQTATSWTITCGSIISSDNVSATVLWNGTGCSTGVLTAKNGSTILASKTITINPPPLVPGSINPSAASIYSGQSPGPLTSTGVSGGNGSYTYQWQSSSNSGFTSPVTISGATSAIYTPPALSSLTYYRVQVTSGTTLSSLISTITILPALIPGTTAPISQTINYNNNASPLTLSGVSGGNGTYTYQWQSYSSNSFSSPITITGATSTTYTPTGLIATTYFRVAVTSSGLTLYSGYDSVKVNPQLLPGIIFPDNINVASGTSPGQILLSAATGGGCNGSYGYQWQSSTDGINFTDIGSAVLAAYTPGAITVKTWYRRQAICGTDIQYTNSFVASIAVAQDPNYIRVRDLTRPGITTTTAADALTDPFDIKQTTQYFDGLGRPIQTVSKQQSPLGKDLVVPQVYDALGREPQKYLPYVATTNDGSFKNTSFQDQNTFNTAQFPGEQYYYGLVNYEPSPLNRPTNTMAPGQSWVGSNKGVGSQYFVNSLTDSVRIWTIAVSPGSIPTTSAIYPTGTLYKNQITDEAGHSVIEYKDMQGKVLLKKVQLAASPGPAHVGWLSTYYVYDDMDNLRFVIQPRAIDLLEANGTWNLTTLTNLTTELCFRYEYDYRKRMIIKKIPGAGEVWMVYDGRDRIVMTQDSSLRALGKWMITKYDIENRSDTTGLLTDANNRAYHQNLSENNSYYPNTSANFELLTQTYYDGYAWTTTPGLVGSINTTYTSNSSYFNTTYNASPVYAQAITQYPIARGMVTGTQTKVLGTTSQFISTVNFFDDHGRVIESQGINQTTAKDTIINQYDFSGKPIRNLVRHQNGRAPVQTHSVLSKMNYDAMGRMLTVYKNIDNAGTDQLISTNSYNELGQLQNKQLGNSPYVDNMSYTYNIRGWLLTINKNFITGTPGNYFGMELGYDKVASLAPGTSYAATQFNGNITGTVWKTAGDGVGRKYDFSYDNLNRLTGADFNQNSGSAFDKAAGIDFSVSGLQYDGNGNILSMNQKGFKVGGSATIDSLSYVYQLNSNKLSIVNDGVNDTASKLGDFHYSGTKQSTDYTYDGNGNLIIDNNKAINTITYNYLNLPQAVTVTHKGTITYIYDASGAKLSKTTVDSTISPVKTTTTTYIGGFVYQATSPTTGGPVAADTLQFIGHEEGRARWAYHKYLNGTSSYGFEYDFFEKDHLGNTRVVLTQQKDTALYLASGEAVYRTTENQLFANLTTTALARTSAPNYPNDLTITNPNDTVFKVSGDVGSHKTGPSLLLKVMSGDKIDLSVQYFYNSGTNTTQNSSVTDVLASLASGIVNMASGGKGSMTDLNNSSGSPLYSALSSFITNDSNPSVKPKAYLNWILLDDQLKYVSSSPQSGAMVVGLPGALGTLANTGIPITKNGFLYIWVSNETVGWNVFFDNLKVAHYPGPLLEETHYYPFGLTMAGISSKALKPCYVENHYKYNGIEYDSSFGVDYYEAFYRDLDPQIGRWTTIDPKIEDRQESISPYVSMNNNPVKLKDPKGDVPCCETAAGVWQATQQVADQIVIAGGGRECGY